jgi:alkylation response protein AidB-like acyl-CoA dehydrogenase
MGQLNAKTLEYTKTREQFGVAIGSFQALQHRMVDTFMSYEQAKSMLYRAVCALDNGDENARREIHALKVMMHKLRQAHLRGGDSAPRRYGHHRRAGHRALRQAPDDDQRDLW